MANINQVIRGLEILSKTAVLPVGLVMRGETDGMKASVAAEHDVIYGPDSDPSGHDITELEALGWYFDGEVESWAIFC